MVPTYHEGCCNGNLLPCLSQGASDDISSPLSYVATTDYMCSSCNDSVHLVLTTQASIAAPELTAIQREDPVELVR